MSIQLAPDPIPAAPTPAPKGIFRLPARLRKLPPRRLTMLVVAALIVLWIVIPTLIPATEAQAVPIVIAASTPTGLIWFAVAVLATAAGLIALGWRRYARPSARKRGCRSRLVVPASLLGLLFLWIIVPWLLPGNLNRAAHVAIRASSPLALLWFVLALIAAALAFIYAGQLLAEVLAARTRRQRVMNMVEGQIDAGIALFSRERQLEYINMAGRFYLFQDGHLIDEVSSLIGRAQESSSVTAQSFTVDERLRVNVQAIPAVSGTVSVIVRVLQSDADQNTFYERFIRRIVHDMRNPLAAIIAHASNLYNTPSSEAAEWQGTARTIENEAQRLTRLVDGLLFDARLSFVPLAAERLDLVDVIEDVMFQHDERYAGRQAHRSADAARTRDNRRRPRFASAGAGQSGR
ncbi:MAG: histidine kinase dimerization/phospho-acceptor domain-containing protein [Anaerolineae bacterium]